MSVESIYSYEERETNYELSSEDFFTLTDFALKPVILTELERRPKRKIPGIAMR